MPPFDKEFFGSDRLDLTAANLFDLVAALDGIAPGFGAIAQARAVFAIDGTIEPDWSTPLAGRDEVIVLPRVGGGQGDGVARSRM